MTILSFMIGFFLGGFLGILGMSLAIISKDKNKDE